MHGGLDKKMKIQKNFNLSFPSNLMRFASVRVCQVLLLLLNDCCLCNIFFLHIQGKHSDYDFKGGAGAVSVEKSTFNKPRKEYVESLSPDPELKDDVSDDSGLLTGKTENDAMETTPVRHSARTAGKALKYYLCFKFHLFVCLLFLRCLTASKAVNNKQILVSRVMTVNWFLISYFKIL